MSDGIAPGHSKPFEEAMKPVWDRVRRMGLSEGGIDALIEEARA